MKHLTDQEFHQWLNAIEREKEIPSSLTPDDAADLQFAQRLFALRSQAPRTAFPDAARSAQIYAGNRESRRIWRFAAATLLVIVLLAAAISSSTPAGAQIFKSLGLAEEESWISPIPVIFEGERYEPVAFQVLYEEELQDVDLIFVLDEGENPTLFAFRSPEEVRFFLEEREGAPPGGGHPGANK